MVEKKVDYSEIFPLAEYYKKVVMPIHKVYTATKGKMVVCPLHDDINPSMGFLYTKEKIEIFNCLGCKTAGNVVEFHQRVCKKHFNRVLSKKDSIKELCNIFNVDIKTIPSDEITTVESEPDKDRKRALLMKEALTKFDIDEFRMALIDGKMEGKGIPYYNSLLIRMVTEAKRLQEGVKK